MRVLICGGRDFNDSELMYKVLDDFCNFNPPIDVLISGGADGADSIAVRWANDRHIPTEIYEADWKSYGRRAGPIRNKRMLDEGKPDLVFAFPGGKGTADMTSRANEAGVRVLNVSGMGELSWVFW